MWLSIRNIHHAQSIITHLIGCSPSSRERRKNSESLLKKFKSNTNPILQHHQIKISCPPTEHIFSKQSENECHSKWQASPTHLRHSLSKFNNMLRKMGIPAIIPEAQYSLSRVYNKRRKQKQSWDEQLSESHAITETRLSAKRLDMMTITFLILPPQF